MKTRTVVLLLAAASHALMAGGGRATLDFHLFDLPDEERAIVERFMPDVIGKSLQLQETTAEQLKRRIVVSSGERLTGDTADGIMVIYYTDELGSGAIRIIDRSTGETHLVWQTDSAAGDGWPGLRFIDLDCDSVKEMIAQSISATGNWSVMIVRRTGSTYRIISGRGEGYGLGGRLVEYRDLDGDCIKEVVVERDKDKKFDMKDKKVFRLDKGAGFYRIDTTLSRSIQK